MVLALECTVDPANSPSDAIYALWIDICGGSSGGYKCEEAVLHDKQLSPHGHVMAPMGGRGEYIELGVVWVRLYVPAAGGLEAVVGLMQTPVGGVERVGIGGAPEAT